jgi:hypothetical protein
VIGTERLAEPRKRFEKIADDCVEVSRLDRRIPRFGELLLEPRFLPLEFDQCS